MPSLFEAEDAGYCSVYAFSKQDADSITKSKSSVGFGQYSVYADRLWIDLDGDTKDIAETLLSRAKSVLDSRGLGYTVWFSGKKGYHICIKITPMYGVDVPYSQLCYVRDTLAIECDYSLYQHGRIISNPGRKHPDTGIRKHLVETVVGTELQIPTVAKPFTSTVVEELNDVDKATLGLHRVQMMILDSPNLLNGMRHTTLWKTAMSCFEAGMSDELVKELMLYANRFFESQKTESEVLRAVEQAKYQSK